MSETTKSADTPITKLRNKLTPYFNLVALVKDQSPRGSLVSQAKICDNLEIKSLLEEIESYANSRAVEALKEAQLESKKHYNKLFYKQIDSFFLNLIEKYMKTDKPRELCELHDDWVGKEGTLCDCGNGEGVCKRDKPDHTLLDRIKDEYAVSKGHENFEGLQVHVLRQQAYATLDKIYNGIATRYASACVKEKEKWISVKQRLPTEKDADENGKVLVYRLVNDSQKPLAKSIYDWHMVKLCDEYTFWQPLPSPPQQ